MWFLPQPLVLLGMQNPESTPVQTVSTQSSDEQYEALLSGTTDAVITAIDNVIGWNRRTGPQDFRVVAQVEQTTPLKLIAHPRYREITELRGADLLVDAVDNGFVIALRSLLLEAGLEPDAYQLIAAGGVKDRYQTLLAGRGNATLLGEQLARQAVEAGYRQIASIQHTYPTFPGQGIVIRSSHPRREQIGGWLRELDLARQGTQDLDSLRPNAEGVALLAQHRRLLGMPGGEDTYSTIVDTSLIDSFLEQTS